MSELRKTGNALSGLAANQYFGDGEHSLAALRVGGLGTFAGGIDYDPFRHSAIDIDPLSAFGMATGQEQVRLVRPHKPLLVNVITDMTAVDEDARITATKHDLAEDLRDAIDGSLPDLGDRLRFYEVGRGATVADSEEVAQNIDQIAKSGLNFVISGFQRLRFGNDRRRDIVAVKVNHPWDRELPATKARIVIDGTRSVNTGKPKELARANADLQRRHEGIVEALRATGVGVASVIARPSMPAGYDVTEADTEIAAAIKDAVKR